MISITKLYATLVVNQRYTCDPSAVSENRPLVPNHSIEATIKELDLHEFNINGTRYTKDDYCQMVLDGRRTCDKTRISDTCRLVPSDYRKEVSYMLEYLDAVSK